MNPHQHDFDGTDGHGQPRIPFPAQHLNNAAKALQELSSICTGILCDGQVSDAEIQYFKDWIERHSQFGNVSWFADLRRRLREICLDGVVDEGERSELREIMEKLRGGSDLNVTYSTPLPLDRPAPNPLLFEGRQFCVTGKFAFGKRAKVMELIRAKGGIPFDTTPSQTTNYLLIGTFASRDWIEQSYGRKIEKAMALKGQGFPIQIVAEEHWRGFVGV